MKRIILLVIFSVVSLFIFTCAFPAPIDAYAHPGRTDSRGGHNDTSNGTYHYHNGGSSSYQSSATQRPSSSQPQATRAPGSSTVSVAGPTPRATTIPPEILDDRDPLYGKTNDKGVNVRKSPSTNAKRVTQIAKTGTAVEIIESLTTNAGEEWYSIWLDEQEVYILAKFIDLIPEEEYLSGE